MYAAGDFAEWKPGSMPGSIPFWIKVTPLTSGCWAWMGSISSNGYGRFYFTDHSGAQKWQAHRYSYHMMRGPIPPGMTIDHLCRNKSCVNPDHLDVVTLKENIRWSLPYRTYHKGLYCSTSCVHGHLWTPETTYYHKGSRSCKVCNRERCKRFRVSHPKIYTGPRLPKKRWSSNFCGRGHELTPGNIYTKKSDGSRECHPCMLENQRRYRLMKRLSGVR